MPACLYSTLRCCHSASVHMHARLGPRDYFIKLRPGLGEFLQELHQKFELHIYTWGLLDYGAMCMPLCPCMYVCCSLVATLSPTEGGTLQCVWKNGCPPKKQRVCNKSPRSEAMGIRQIIDPDASIFGDRIISRETFPDLDGKSLQVL